MNAFDLPLPKSRLEDVLYAYYGGLFSDGTKGIDKGELASYHGIRKETADELNNMNFIKTSPQRRQDNLQEFQMVAGYFTELDKAAAAFSSTENRNAIFKVADEAGKSTNIGYNAIIFLAASAALIGAAESLRRKEIL